MRIIAGRLGGRIFDSPGGRRTHPMGDRVRGALFNALGDITGLSVLDAFTGSGALAFEALSRGATHAVALDIDKTAITTVVKSSKELGVGNNLKIVHASASAWMATVDHSEFFDIVLCDPPYDDVRPALLVQLAECTHPGGLVVLSLPPRAVVTLPAGYELLQHKNYGDAELVFYRRLQ